MDKMAQADTYDVTVPTKHNNFQVGSHQLYTSCCRDASSMRYVKRIRLKVR